ncbi:hypothetical protein Hanom_Chr16g01453411 [Helianthus anomalus]
MYVTYCKLCPLSSIITENVLDVCKPLHVMSFSPNSINFLWLNLNKWPMISRSSGGGLAFLLRDAGSTPTWCRVRHWWAMIGDPGKPGLDP